MSDRDHTAEAGLDPPALEQSTGASGKPPAKTPMYKALNSARYQRQELIAQINSKVRTHLLCYVSGRRAEVERDDIFGLVDALHNVPRGESIDFLLHTRGGDLDVAEKLIFQVQSAVGEARLRVIVPDFAKSAGTLMALGANAIVMSDPSELGPIDPQIVLSDDHGNELTHSVLDYLEAVEEHADALRRNPNDPAAKMMLEKLDPTTVSRFESVRDRARVVAEKQLLRNGIPNFTEIANKLIDKRSFPSHGQMINWEDALQLGLNIEYVNPDNPIWQAWWDLYCLLRLAVKDNEKIFESNYASYLT